MNCVSNHPHQNLGLTVVFCLLSFGWAGQSWAHKVSSVSAIVNIDTKAQTYELNAAMDVERSEDEALNDEISPEEAARIFAEDYLVIQFDGKDQEPELKIDTLTASDEDTPEELQRQQIMTTLTGPIPKGAKEFLMYLDPTCPMAVVMVIVKDKKPARRMQVVLAGEFSRPVNVEPVVDGDPFTKNDDEKTEAKADAVIAAATDEASKAESGDTSVSMIREGWKNFGEGWLLYLSAIVAVLIVSLSLKPAAYRIGTLILGQSFGFSLAAFKIVAAPYWLLPAIGVGLILLALSALIRRPFHGVRIGLIFVVGIAQGAYLTQMIPFRRIFEATPAIDLSDLIQFYLGMGFAQVVAVVLASSFLILVSRKSGLRNKVVTVLIALISGYGLYVAGSAIL